MANSFTFSASTEIALATVTIIAVIISLEDCRLGFQGPFEGQRSLLGRTSGPGEVCVSTGWWVPVTLALGTHGCAQDVQSLAQGCGMSQKQSASGVQQRRWPRALAATGGCALRVPWMRVQNQRGGGWQAPGGHSWNHLGTFLGNFTSCCCR